MKSEISQELEKKAKESLHYKGGLKFVKKGVVGGEINLAKGYASLEMYDNQEYYYPFVQVSVKKIYSPSPQTSCSCKQWISKKDCNHTAAILIIVANKIDEFYLEKPLATTSTGFNIELINLDSLRLYSGKFGINSSPKYNSEIVKFLNGDAIIHVFDESQKYTVKLKYNLEKQYLETSCDCGQKLNTLLCDHKLEALTKIYMNYGENGLKILGVNDSEKERLLSSYGYSLKDNYADLFDFNIIENRAIITPKSASLIRLDEIESLNLTPIPKNENLKKIILPKTDYKNIKDWMVCLRPSKESTLRDYRFEIYNCQIKSSSGKVTHLKEISDSHPDIVVNAPQAIAKINEVLNNLKLNSIIYQFEGSSYYRNYKHEQGSFEDLSQLRSLELKYLSQLWKYLNEVDFYLSDEVQRWDGYFLTNGKSLKKVTAAQELLTLRVEVYEDDRMLGIKALVNIPGQDEILLNELIENTTFWFLIFDEKVYRWKDYQSATLAQYLLEYDGEIKTPKVNAVKFFEKIIIPLSETYDLDLSLPVETVYKDSEFLSATVYLKELDENLLIYPVIKYKTEKDEELEMTLGENSEKIYYQDGKIEIVDKGKAVKKQIESLITESHPDFIANREPDFYFLPFDKVLEDGWLFNFYEKLKENNIETYGQKDLKGFKYNLNRAKVKWKASSGIDWFDFEGEISFGDEIVELKDVRKAILNQKDFILLKDGTKGLLPKDWLEKYTNLFKLGSLKNNKLKVSKLHFSLIDELANQIDNQELLEELHQKKEKIKNFKEIENIKIPKGVNATLRDYQMEGYNWLNFLDEFEWGDCLADDMGLGKTLQVLTFLKNQLKKHPKKVNLIIVPTSLIYNWQAEIEKFTPDLKYYIFYGTGRDKDLKDFGENRLVLTTYGMVRSDIEFFRSFKFNYVILDEAQAIKNPDAQISKAVRLLKARNRITMTGTPIENNTFDLYSQFEFLNPGFLMGEEFFRKEFANKIDKNQDKEASDLLRKMIYPFMLKRTKDEVAKDLPDKTESILYCEMSKKQKKVYDAFRDKYRIELLQKIDNEGRGKSGMLILEALTKLRQICDSAGLLNEDAVYPSDSIKLDILMEEIRENASDHKILVFSQFLKMLDMVKQELDKLGIKYEYIDGSVSDRLARVNRFQTDKNCRIFLSTLKTGGVGLNLTEADYVYMIDPWWNPAVEQQAIDRTHRIGQTKKVFAYKMICKDTIEEKILKLQEKKKSLAEDLVGAETGFIKKLTRDDIVDLFT